MSDEQVLTKTSLVVFEHSDFYIVNKPNGVDFHDEGNLGQGFFNQCQDVLSSPLFPVHRLDKVTSGLVILARNLDAARFFQKAFEDKMIQKYYIALGANKPKKKQGSIIGDMSKARRSQWKLLKTKTSPAITRFKTWSLEHNEQANRLFLLKPETGKTHQLRVALKSLGTPIVGDDLYGSEASDRTYLHAARLCFTYLDQHIDANCMPTVGSAFLDNIKMIASIVEEANSLSWPGAR